MTEAQEARAAMREGRWTGPTVYRVPGYVQTNLVVLSRAEAYDFLLYCQRNPKPCPVIEVTDPGDPEPRQTAPGADLRTDLPLYRVFRRGVQDEDVQDIRRLWREDSVAFLVGSSLSFDAALERAGVPRSEEVWMYRTAIRTVPAGRFQGPLIVTMRLMTPAQALIATQLTARFIYTHGAPVHVGDPREIGADPGQPLWGRPLPRIPEGKTGVFWACGVTPQYAVQEAKPELMIAHSPGHAFITDLLVDRFCLP
jgi:uncharacterized protein YcsI (UPF0317 family)